MADFIDSGTTDRINTATTKLEEQADRAESILNDLVAGTGGGAVTSVNTKVGDVVLTTDDVDDAGNTNKYTTAADIDKLSGIEAGAEKNTVISVHGRTGVVVGAAGDYYSYEIADNSTPDNYTPTDSSVKGHLEGIDTALATAGGGGGGGKAKWGSITGDLSTQADLKSALDGKVDIVSGKGLSTNDYTTIEKNKLAGIPSNAQANTVSTVFGRLGAVVAGANDYNDTLIKTTTTPVNYIASEATVKGHLKGIDDALASAGGGGGGFAWSDYPSAQMADFATWYDINALATSSGLGKYIVTGSPSPIFKIPFRTSGSVVVTITEPIAGEYYLEAITTGSVGGNQGYYSKVLTRYVKDGFDDGWTLPSASTLIISPQVDNFSTYTKLKDALSSGLQVTYGYNVFPKDTDGSKGLPSDTHNQMVNVIELKSHNATRTNTQYYIEVTEMSYTAPARRWCRYMNSGNNGEWILMQQ